MLAEYASNTAATSPQKEYGYRNGQLLITADVTTGPPVPTFSDDFNDNSLDPAKWSVVDPNSPAVVSETGQRLQITLPPNTAAYNGIYSNSTFDLTGKSVQVEVAQTVSQAGWSENFIQVVLDANNYYLISVGSGSLVFRSMAGGVNNQTVIGYDPNAFPYWHIRHDQAANTINLETSSNGTAWTTRKTVTAGFSLTALRFYLYAGAWGTGNGSPGAAKYDNFQLVGNTPSTVVNLQWLVADQLGTPRMVFDKTGALANVKRHDYLPFGEELSAGQGLRTPTLGYGAADGVRQKFTRQERDNETSLDYFGARYFSSTLGRFTSTDPIYFQTMMAIDPQRFNLYSHTRNNPLRYVDPSGERLQASGSGAMGVLYQMVGGQDNFDQYFVVIDGEVLPQPGVSFAGANAGITQLLELVNAQDTYRVYAGESGEEAARLFEGAVGKDGKLNDKGKDLAGRFNGGGNRITGVGTLGGTSGRTDQPAALANGDPVFAVIAINTNVIMTQEAISNDYKEARGDSMATVELGAQTEGVGQRVKAVSYVLHETAENLVFADQRTRGKPYDYSSAHIAAMHREAQVRRDLGITGGFAGGEIKTEMPKKH